MNLKEAKVFVDDIFQQIKNAGTIEQLIEIEKNNFEKKYLMDPNAYPKIDFDIQPAEIQHLIDMGLMDESFALVNNASEKLEGPLVKLLFAMAWKNGDLKKLQHIAKGIAEIEQKEITQDKALVFYQFGRFLTKTPGQPIIDQHVIRAYGIYISLAETEWVYYAKLEALQKKDKPIINNYIEWLQSSDLKQELKKQPDYSYHIDKILFALGRVTKGSVLE